MYQCCERDRDHDGNCDRHNWRTAQMEIAALKAEWERMKNQCEVLEIENRALANLHRGACGARNFNEQKIVNLKAEVAKIERDFEATRTLNEAEEDRLRAEAESYRKQHAQAFASCADLLAEREMANQVLALVAIPVSHDGKALRLCERITLLSAEAQVAEEQCDSLRSDVERMTKERDEARSDRELFRIERDDTREEWLDTARERDSLRAEMANVMTQCAALENENRSLANLHRGACDERNQLAALVGEMRAALEFAKRDCCDGIEHTTRLCAGCRRIVDVLHHLPPTEALSALEKRIRAEWMQEILRVSPVAEGATVCANPAQAIAAMELRIRAEEVKKAVLWLQMQPADDYAGLGDVWRALQRYAAEFERRASEEKGE